jgi:hypothetical protein
VYIPIVTRNHGCNGHSCVLAVYITVKQIDYLKKHLDVGTEDIIAIGCRTPAVLMCSLESNIMPKVSIRSCTIILQSI